LQQLLQSLGSPNIKESNLNTIKPWRRRAICHFAIRNFETLPLEPISAPAFLQYVNDYRELPRVFQTIEPGVMENVFLKNFIRFIAKTVHAMTGCQTLRITAHQMRQITVKGQISTNAPEGVHQDGVDYVVPALVIARENISGGESLIYDKRKRVIYERTLTPGEALLHSERDFYHNVGPIRAVDDRQPSYRDIFGLDLVCD